MIAAASPAGVIRVIEPLIDWQARTAAVAKVARVHADAVDREGRFPAESIAALRASGLLGAMVPAAQGGLGQPLHVVAAVAAELAQACASTAMIFAMHQIQVACLLNHAGDSAFLHDLVSRVATAPLLLASVTSEVGVGGEIRRSLAAVESSGDGFTLAKHGSTVSYGQFADGLLITARSAPDAAPNGQVMVAVTSGQYQLERTGVWNAMGMRGTCSDAFKVAANGDRSQILASPFGEINDSTMLPVSHLLWGSLWFGIAQDALARARGSIRAEMKRRGELPGNARDLPDLFGKMQLLHARLCASLARYEAMRAMVLPQIPFSLSTDLTLLKTTMSNGCLEVVQQALATIGFAAYRNEAEWSLGRHLRDLHSAPLMINNARITEAMSNFLLLDPMKFGLVPHGR